MLGFNFEFLEDVRYALERRGVPATDAYVNPGDMHRIAEENSHDIIEQREEALVIMGMVFHRDENVPAGEVVMLSTDHPSRGISVGRVVSKLAVAREISYRNPETDSWEFSQVETAEDYGAHIKRAARGWVRNSRSEQSEGTT